MLAMLAPQAAKVNSRPPAHVRALRGCKPVIHSADRDNWLAARKTGIGASDVAAALGLSPWKSPFTLYMELTGGVSDRKVTPEEAERMAWGLDLEAAIAAGYSRRTGASVKPCGWLLRSKPHPWLLATPDFLECDATGAVDAILEIKNVRESSAPFWDHGAPDHYIVQLQTQLLVAGHPAGVLAALVGGEQMRRVPVPESKPLQAEIVKRTKAFWGLVHAGTAPVPDASESTTRTLCRMMEDGTSLDLPDEVLEWHLEASRAADDERAAGERKEGYRRKIVAFLGTASEGVLPGGRGRYTFHTVTRAGYAVEAKTFRQLKFLPGSRPKKGETK